MSTFRVLTLVRVDEGPHPCHSLAGHQFVGLQRCCTTWQRSPFARSLCSCFFCPKRFDVKPGSFSPKSEMSFALSVIRWQSKLHEGHSSWHCLYAVRRVLVNCQTTNYEILRKLRGLLFICCPSMTFLVNKRANVPSTFRWKTPETRSSLF